MVVVLVAVRNIADVDYKAPWAACVDPGSVFSIINIALIFKLVEGHSVELEASQHPFTVQLLMVRVEVRGELKVVQLFSRDHGKADKTQQGLRPLCAVITMLGQDPALQALQKEDLIWHHHVRAGHQDGHRALRQVVPCGRADQRLTVPSQELHAGLLQNPVPSPHRVFVQRDLGLEGVVSGQQPREEPSSSLLKRLHPEVGGQLVDALDGRNGDVDLACIQVSLEPEGE